MTLQEAKDQVASKYGAKSWEDWMSPVKQECLGKGFLVLMVPEFYMDEVMDVYARSKWDEACEVQSEVIKDRYYNTELDEVQSIIDAPKPEFKP